MARITALAAIAATLLSTVSAQTPPPPGTSSSAPSSSSSSSSSSKRPNILFIITDDQDLRLDSTAYQPTLREKITDFGTWFEKHFVTISICCPSRAALWRGQAAHNTNNTYVSSPGGGYTKWKLSGEDKNNLPHWLKRAGYRSEYLGKLLNGIDLSNYNDPPDGWDHSDLFIEPYTYIFNSVVMSENGKTPIFYDGFHQTDIIRTKALARLEHLTSQAEPWFLAVAPTAPHNEQVTPGKPPVPLQRHSKQFTNLTAPRVPSFNPSDDVQKNKVSWLKRLPLLNKVEVDLIDTAYQKRLQSLQGVDEIIEDTVKLLEEKGQLGNTYVIYTSDNGYHLGNHRVAAGKTLPYVTDSNVPFVVRGPGIAKGAVSTVPSTHIDFVPTFLDIAGLPNSEWPVFLDGRSLLPEWTSDSRDLKAASASAVGEAKDYAREVINIEFWGMAPIESPNRNPIGIGNTYKTLRIVTDEASWLYSHWCTGESELYNTKLDPWELTNLALAPDAATQRLITRLNAVLLVTKSCTQGSCRNPWATLQPPTPAATIHSLADALDPALDAHFAGIPKVSYAQCMQYQLASNERPFFPPEAEFGLGLAFRNATDNYPTPPSTAVKIEPSGEYGGVEQRHVTLEEILKKSRPLTGEELDVPKDQGLLQKLLNSVH